MCDTLRKVQYTGAQSISKKRSNARSKLSVKNRSIRSPSTLGLNRKITIPSLNAPSGICRSDVYSVHVPLIAAKIAEGKIRVSFDLFQLHGGGSLSEIRGRAEGIQIDTVASFAFLLFRERPAAEKTAWRE